MARHYGYKSGQNVSCRVLAREGNGYSLVTIKELVPAFLVTNTVYKKGDEILGKFVCMHGGRMLLDPLFSSVQGDCPVVETISAKILPFKPRAKSSD